MNRFVAFAAAGFAISISAHAYDRATVYNSARFPASVTVKYAACKSDTFVVPAKTTVVAAQATAPTNRGGCLITSISGHLNGATYPIASYTSSGTSYSLFLIRYDGKNGYKIMSNHEPEIAARWNDILTDDLAPGMVSIEGPNGPGPRNHHVPAGKAGDSCDAKKPCGTGLTCQAPANKCVAGK